VRARRLEVVNAGAFAAGAMAEGVDMHRR